MEERTEQGVAAKRTGNRRDTEVNARKASIGRLN